MHHVNGASRRAFVRCAGMAAAAAVLRPCSALAASYADQFPDMLLAYMAKKVNALAAKWDEERASIQTPEEILRRNRFVREKGLEMLHGLPPRCPLAATTVATHALWVLFAAVLDNRIANLICQRGLLSYGMLARVDRYSHSAGEFVRDILTRFDLPEIAAALTGRELTLVSPADPMKRAVPLETARRAYIATAAAFAKAGRAEHFRIAASLEI